nr:MAG TPA: hypothetical protein [Caudoviricetes sp.]
MLNDANLRGLQHPNKKSVKSLQPFSFSRGSPRILHRGKLPSRECEPIKPYLMNGK